MKLLPGRGVYIEDKAEEVQVTIHLPKKQTDALTRDQFYHALMGRLEDIHDRLMAMWDERHPGETAAKVTAAVRTIDERG